MYVDLQANIIYLNYIVITTQSRTPIYKIGVLISTLNITNVITIVY